MQKKLLAEIEGRYVRQSCSNDKFAVVTLQIYSIDAGEVLFENHCAPERLPERFAAGVERGVQHYASEHDMSGILVALLDGQWHTYDSSEQDFEIAALKALLEFAATKRTQSSGVEKRENQYGQNT